MASTACGLSFALGTYFRSLWHCWLDSQSVLFLKPLNDAAKDTTITKLTLHCQSQGYEGCIPDMNFSGQVS